MNTSIHQWLQLVKPDIRIFLWVSLGIFLFTLFFQPFTLEQFDFNNRLLVVAGLGGITFILMMLTRSFFPFIESTKVKQGQSYAAPGLYSSLILLALGSVAFAFYLRYVGFVEITFFVMFKVIFICLVPPVVLRLCDAFREIRLQNQKLKSHVEKTGMNENSIPAEEFAQPIIFTSDNSAENLSLLTRDVLFIKSADNYVEVGYLQGEFIKTQLLRNTLKRIEEQLKPYPDFIRCHRISIVNRLHIEKLEIKNQNHWITVRGYSEKLPVSRQYLIKVKERIQRAQG